MATVTHDREQLKATPGFVRSLGAIPQIDGTCLFRVWAPRQERLALHLVSPANEIIEMQRDEHGYFETRTDVLPGARYLFRLNEGIERPDPFSRLQPETVHGPSEVVSLDFEWTDQRWRGLALQHFVIYELHIGTFTPEGTFESAIRELPRLRELGITAIEIMPVAQFPGTRNWGYDGVYPSAVQNSYGGPSGLQRFVDAIHGQGMAAILDVVYNHLGPEGNYLSDFGPYFTDRYQTPWGMALNFDGADSDEVRRYFMESALSWIVDFHFDALRLDAVHAIVDHSAYPFLAQLTDAVHELAHSIGRPVYVIAESDLNDPRLLQPPDRGGYAMDAQWSDDFHHSLHTLLTGETTGYYADFGSIDDVATVFQRAFRYAGEYSHFRRRRYGAPPHGIEANRFIVCSQNHDQIGNRMMGDRLSSSLHQAQLRLAAAAVILSPFLPLLFMGEEYGETAPFQYFTSHSDPGLVEAVRNGRRAEFAAFEWKGEVPDPDDEATFQRSQLSAAERRGAEANSLAGFYRFLIRLRSEVAGLHSNDLSAISAEVLSENALALFRGAGEAPRSMLILNFGAANEFTFRCPDGSWAPRFRSDQHGVAFDAGAVDSKGTLRIELGSHEASFWLREQA